jgi:DNA/RNA endonuclease YhcR with UshA esterase domain
VLQGAAYSEGKWKNADVDAFKGKVIRVKGTIAEYGGKNQIQVRDTHQIEIVE